uniref:Endonuclease/exonuclease/phosphatase domain-containing protein n=1 Tax=Cannabis sativa TaxID=3483 RepID=A0A803PSG8_CANSA
MEKKFVDWDYYTSSTVEGRLLIVWRKSFVRVIVIEENAQHTQCYIKMDGQNNACCITFVYGYNTNEERKQLWSNLLKLKFLVKLWLIAGDFNALFDLEDREGDIAVTLSDIQDASLWLAQRHLELLLTGSNFTWANNQEGHKRIYSKIDHIFANEDWNDSFPNTKAHYSWETISDHNACVVSVKVSEKIRVKPFRYFNFWAYHPEFKNVVMKSWNKPLRCTGMKTLYFKLVRLKHCFKRFNNHVIGDVGKEYEAAKDMLIAAKMNSQADPRNLVLQQQEKEAVDKYCMIENMYHSFLSQRSKVTWLNKGDDNNVYFHACLKKRRVENRIVFYTNDQGESIDHFPKVVDHFVAHFKGYMGTQSMPSKSINYDSMALGTRINLDQQLSLLKPFSSKEVKEALFSIPDSKSPGPDGYGAGFFKQMWLELG